MRSSYDSLLERAKVVLKKDPMSGHLFLFVNTSRSSMKALYYDGTGLVIISKRLERGLFSKFNPMYRGQIVLTQAEFNLFFEGANLEKRFIESPVEVKRRSSLRKNAANYFQKKSENSNQLLQRSGS
jgi:transposase